MIRSTLLFTTVLLTTACASTSSRPDPKYQLADCQQLRSAIATQEQDKRAAEEKRDGAWKVVIPFAVLGRYASGAAQADAADRHLAELNQHAGSKGCSL